MLSRDELCSRLDAANKLDSADNGGVTTETYWRTMRALLGEAEALGDTALIFRARLAYGWALRDSKSPQNGYREISGEWLDLLRRCLVMWKDDPHRFPYQHVSAMWSQFFSLISWFIKHCPEPAERVHRLIDELERQCLPSRPVVFHVLDEYRMELEARRGNLEEVERLWRELQLREPPKEHLQPDGTASVNAIMWRRLGRDDRAIETLAPVLTGQIPSRPNRVYVDDLLIPYLRTCRTDEAVAAHQSTYTRPGLKLEEVASHLEFCALTGNEERGLDVLHRNLRFMEGDVRSVEGMWTVAAAALLCRRITEKDLDEEWVWPCAAGCQQDHSIVWSYAALGAELRWQAIDFAARLDELNGTSFQSEAISKLLHAEPIIDDLELPPAMSEPAHRAKPGLSPHLAAATAEELRAELDRARQMDRGRERILTLQRLQQNAIATDEQGLLLDVRFAYLDKLLSCNPTAWRPELFATFATLVHLHDTHSTPQNTRPTPQNTDPALRDTAPPDTDPTLHDPAPLNTDPIPHDTHPALHDPALHDPALHGTDPVCAERLGRLWAAAPVVLDRVLSRATVHIAQIRGLMRVLERHCRPGTHDLHHLRWYQVELEVRCGDVDAARSALARFDALPPCDTYTTWPNVLRRARWWLDLGFDREAIAAMAPVLSGDIPADEDREDYLLMPYLRSGQADKARAVHERTFSTAARAPEIAAHLEFCARTGELTRAKEIIQRNLGLYHVSYDDCEFSFDDLRSCAAMAAVCRRIVADGEDETWTWPADECCPAEDDWTYARMATSCRNELALFGTRWEELTGSTFHTHRHAAIADIAIADTHAHAHAEGDADADTPVSDGTGPTALPR
ncbi:hypothetical protein [Spirillospora sp. NPDC048819]|uniref:hypothetical protein n=1 Tax=Spirillospora sp. NPDC048819 TaxID=3155268 RepID=UPI0033CC8488